VEERAPASPREFEEAPQKRPLSFKVPSHLK
jgi:hypothetical protein